MAEGSSGEQPRVKSESGTVAAQQIRRWQDKLLGFLVFVVLGLIGTVYAIHSADIKKADEHAAGAEKRLENHAEKTRSDFDRVQADQRAHAERIRALEENRGEINRRLDSIDKSLERQDVKHDQINTKVDKLLDRVK